MQVIEWHVRIKTRRILLLIHRLSVCYTGDYSSRRPGCHWVTFSVAFVLHRFCVPCILELCVSAYFRYVTFTPPLPGTFIIHMYMAFGQILFVSFLAPMQYIDLVDFDEVLRAVP